MGARHCPNVPTPGVWERQPYQCSHCRADLAHDYSDDDEGRLRFGAGCRTEAEGAADHVVRELDRQAIFHGLPRLGVLSRSLFVMDNSIGGRSIHRGLHHPGSRPLHSDGLCLELPDRWRSGPHAGASVGE